jgi:hypothetical protein
METQTAEFQGIKIEHSLIESYSNQGLIGNCRIQQVNQIFCRAA